MDLSPAHEFITSPIGHPENIGSLSYKDLANVDSTFHYPKKSYVNISLLLISSENSLSIGKLSNPKWQTEVIGKS